MSSAICAVSSGWELQNDLVTWHLAAEGTFSLHPKTNSSSWLYGTSALTTRLEPRGAVPHRSTPGSLTVTIAQENYANGSGIGVHLEAEAALPLPGGALLLQATLYRHSPLLHLHIGVSNSSPTMIKLEHLIPALIEEAARMSPSVPSSFSIAGKSKGWASHDDGWQSWSYAGSLPPGKATIQPKIRTLRAMHQPFSPAISSLFSSWEQLLISEGLTLVGFPQSLPALLVGFLRETDQAGQMVLDCRNGRLAAVSHAESHILASNFFAPVGTYGSLRKQGQTKEMARQSVKRYVAKVSKWVGTL